MNDRVHFFKGSAHKEYHHGDTEVTEEKNLVIRDYPRSIPNGNYVCEYIVH